MDWTTLWNSAIGGAVVSGLITLLVFYGSRHERKANAIAQQKQADKLAAEALRICQEAFGDALTDASNLADAVRKMRDELDAVKEKNEKLDDENQQLRKENGRLLSRIRELEREVKELKNGQDTTPNRAQNPHDTT